jgi:hypothetical protein
VKLLDDGLKIHVTMQEITWLTLNLARHKMGGAIYFHKLAL